MAYKKAVKLVEITNTSRSKKVAVEEPEHCAIVPDDDALCLHLDVSDDAAETQVSDSQYDDIMGSPEDIFDNIKLDLNDILLKKRRK